MREERGDARSFTNMDEVLRREFELKYFLEFLRRLSYILGLLDSERPEERELERLLLRSNLRGLLQDPFRPLKDLWGLRPR